MASSLERRSGAFLAARRLCQSSLPAMASLIICTAALCNTAGATTASMAPTLRASSARTSLPVVIHSRALSAPITRGRRTVPPKPGMMPSLVSGRPILAVVSASRKSVESIVSQPPPRAWPLMAERVGTGRSSMALKMSLAFFSQPSRSSCGRSNSSRNSVMSAPTIKASLPEVRIRPFKSACCCNAAIASLSESRVARSSLLTEPGASNLSSAMPCSR